MPLNWMWIGVVDTFHGYVSLIRFWWGIIALSIAYASFLNYKYTIHKKPQA
jgi:hypothetical protein